jgi:TolB-like protein
MASISDVAARGVSRLQRGDARRAEFCERNRVAIEEKRIATGAARRDALRIADALPPNPADAPSPVGLAREPDFQLGGLRVRPSRREIATARGERTFVEPKVMRVLVALVAGRGEVVSRDELIATCWDGRIVGDDAINACVAKARRVGASTGAYDIETVPRVGYRLTVAETTPTVAVASPVEEVLLAVLPFDNLSDDPQLSYFSDGVSEEILHTLAQRTGLRVIGRSSSFQFRGGDKAIANVTRQLGVTHVLDGAVRRSGGRTRISAQLIDCATQTAMWADRFERDQPEIFALQDQVAAAVAHAMRSALAPAVRSGTVDPVAYDLYLRGNVPPDDMGDGYRTQIDQLEVAVERAPRFADAWGSLGYLRANRAYFLPPAEAAVLRREARSAALHALELDPRCAVAAAAMARAGPAWEAAAEHEAWLVKALEWAPDNTVASLLYARHLSGVGRVGEGLAVIRRAHRLDPLDIHVLAMLGRTLCENGHQAEAARMLEQTRDRWGDFQISLIWLAIAVGRSGDPARARQILAGHDLGPYKDDVAAFFEFHIDPTAASGARAVAVLREQQASGAINIYALCAAAECGYLDEAFEAVAKARLGPADQFSGIGGSAYNLSILFTQLMAPLRRDRRFVALCTRLGLVDYWLTTGAWPDCVAETVGHYDFKAECRRAAEATRPASD